MLNIFEDEMCKNRPIMPNPEGTMPIWLLDVTLTSLKGETLLRRSKLANNQMGLAGITARFVNRS